MIGYGGRTFTFYVNAKAVDNQTVVPITASAAGSLTADLTINPATLIGLSIAPATVAGGNSATGTVTFDLPAGPSGTVVSLTTNNLVAQVPASVTVPATATSASFTINTTAVTSSTSAQITANLRNVPQSATLGINPVALASVSVSPATVLGGTPSTGTVTLDGPAGTAGIVVSLKSSSLVATLPASVTIPAGQTSTTFAITTTIVSLQVPVTITASEGGQKPTTVLTVNPATPSALVLTPASVLGGSPSSATLTLNGPAGSAGVVVSLTSSSQSAQIPSTITVLAGSNTATFPITTTGVNSGVLATITASLVGVSKSANLSIEPTSLLTFTVTPLTVVGGTTATGTLTLLGPASPTGTPVTIASLNPIASVPASVVVPAGQKTATFTISTGGVTSQTYAVITASMNGQLQQTITLVAPSLISVTLNPPIVSGVSPSTGTVWLNGPAGPAGVVVGLSSNSKLAAVPKSVAIAPGNSTGNFTVTTTAVTAKATATVTANLLGVTETAVLTLVPEGLFSVTVNPTTVDGGVSSTGTVTLTGIAPKGGTVVRLSSSDSAAASVPGSVTVPAGSLSANFTVKTLGVATKTMETITGKVGTTSETAFLTVNPAVLESLTLNPTTVAGGQPSTGTVTVKGVAPPSGLVIQLTSSKGSAAVPAKVTIPGGKTSATFTVKTTTVATQNSATITATSNGVTESASLTINPIGVLSLKLNPTSVTGGKSSTATVQLSGAAPTGGIIVTLASSGSFASIPATVTVAAGKTTATFTVKTTTVQATSTASISATLAGGSASATLTVK